MKDDEEEDGVLSTSIDPTIVYEILCKLWSFFNNINITIKKNERVKYLILIYSL